MELKRSRTSTLTAAALLLTVGAFAQTPAAGAPLVGTWILVRVDNALPDGTRTPLYGESPQGLLMFDAQGRYALQILREGRPRFAANDKSKGTPEENQAAVQGSNSHFGRYTVDAGSGTLIFHIEHASYPNWEGTEQKRTYTLSADRLKYVVPTPTTGAAVVGEVEWRRAR